MADPAWLYEAGIGEARAALLADGTIVAAAIEIDGTLRRGTVAPARLIELLPGRQGLVRLDDGTEALLTTLPRGATQGAALTVEIVREAIPEAGRPKQPRAVATDAAPAPGPDLLARITATGLSVRHARAHEADALEAAGWSELLDEAMRGEIGFALGALRMTPTPAMTLFDVDGPQPVGPLAIAAARAVCAAIRRHRIGGSIGIDFPTLSNKAERIAVADAIDAHLPQPFERTAVNGFGFLQIVRPRAHASLPEMLRADPVGAAARAALRQIERTPPGGPRRHTVPAAVVARIAREPGWRAELDRRCGVVHSLEPA